MRKFNQPFWHKPADYKCGPLLHQHYIGKVESATRKFGKIYVVIDGKQVSVNYRKKIETRIIDLLNNPREAILPFYIQTYKHGTKKFLSDDEALWV